MTLFEVILTLTILCVCTSVISLFFPLLQTESRLEQDIHMFFQQMKDDVDFAYEMEAKKDVLFVNSTHQYQYFLSGSNIIRTKDGAGYEIVLQGIKKFTINTTVYGVDITVTDQEGTSWKAAIGLRPAAERREDWWITEVP